jgi:hypothetical protein
MEYSGAGGKLIHEKNQKQKISWHCPFKLRNYPIRRNSAPLDYWELSKPLFRHNVWRKIHNFFRLILRILSILVQIRGLLACTLYIVQEARLYGVMISTFSNKIPSWNWRFKTSFEQVLNVSARKSNVAARKMFALKFNMARFFLVPEKVRRNHPKLPPFIQYTLHSTYFSPRIYF